MRTIASSSMPFVREAFETLGETVVLGGRAISADDVRDADILAIRSTTKVNRDLLAGSSVKFVGTATIGIDHLDTDFLERQGIGWCYSPGCNANSVSEYITAALLEIAARHGVSLRGMTLGVIGVGNVGRRVVRKAEALGMQVLQNDPPRARCEGEAGFTALEEVLRRADVVSLHVPLTTAGEDATFHLADAAFFARCKPDVLFLNAARGGVMDTPALRDALQSGRVGHAVIDTWEDEPHISPELLREVELGTPHIAGYSYDGKVAGTVSVYQAACSFLGRDAVWSPDVLLPAPEVPDVRVAAGGRRKEEVLNEVVRRVYDISQDDKALREVCVEAAEQRAAGFDALRKNYPVRREFRFTRVSAQGASGELLDCLRGLGFQLDGGR